VPHVHLVTEIAAPPQVCFDVARDVGVHLAASPSQQVVGGVSEGLLSLGDEVTWRARHFGVAWRMTSRIVEFEPPRRFVDEMQRGPFQRWRHQHSFEPTAAGTRMVDDVEYASPLGPLGVLVDAAVLARYMTRLLRRQNQHVRATAEGGGGAMSTGRRVVDDQPRGRKRGTFEVCGEGEATMRCDPTTILDFVLDVERYRRADHKIGRIHHVRRDGDSGEVRHNGRFFGLPTPPATLRFELTAPSRLDFRGVALPWPLRGFEGSFICSPTPEGTSLQHRECFSFGPITGRFVGALFGGWLARDTQAEVVRMKRLIEVRAPDGQVSDR
jgi:ligand-binding SRPBCC domain-containing protein